MSHPVLTQSNPFQPKFSASSCCKASRCSTDAGPFGSATVSRSRNAVANRHLDTARANMAWSHCIASQGLRLKSTHHTSLQKLRQVTEQWHLAPLSFHTVRIAVVLARPQRFLRVSSAVVYLFEPQALFKQKTICCKSFTPADSSQHC